MLLEEIPWDWSNLIASIEENGRLEIDEHDIINKINDKTIEFAKIKLKVESVVYENASTQDIIEGFKELNSFFDFLRVIEVLLQSSLIGIKDKLDIYLAEPDVVDFLKICYWYKRIKTIKTIEHKRKEIRSRLCKKLLYKLERNKTTIDYSNLSNDEIKKKIDDTLDDIRKKQSQEDKKQILQWLNEYLNFVNVCISELMFPVLANDSNFKVDFIPANNNYDYDIIIDGHHVQIKTLFSYDKFPFCESESRKQEQYVEDSKKVKELYNKKQITRDYLKQEIIKYIKSNCIDKINKSLRQKAEIIILDGTRTIPGLLLNYYYTDDSVFVKIHDSFIESLNHNSNDFVPVIFASTSYDKKFRISSLVVKVPMTNRNQVMKWKKIRYTYKEQTSIEIYDGIF